MIFPVIVTMFVVSLKMPFRPLNEMMLLTSVAPSAALRSVTPSPALPILTGMAPPLDGNGNIPMYDLETVVNGASDITPDPQPVAVSRSLAQSIAPPMTVSDMVPFGAVDPKKTPVNIVGCATTPDLLTPTYVCRMWTRGASTRTPRAQLPISQPASTESSEPWSNLTPCTSIGVAPPRDEMPTAESTMLVSGE